MFKSHLLLFITLILFRLFNSLYVQTYFSADEYYQGTEIAHSLYFPNTTHIIPWEWHSENRLRGFVHPIILSMAYPLMKPIDELTQLPQISHYLKQAIYYTGNSQQLLSNKELHFHVLGFLSWWLPRAVQSIMTALSDMVLFAMCLKYFERNGRLVGMTCVG